MMVTRPRRRPLVVTGRADQLPDRGLRRHRQGHDAGLIFLALAILFHLVLKYTVYGKHTYAIGSNEEAARMSGIKVERHMVLVYTIAGVLASLAGIVLSSKNLTAQAGMGVMYELDAIAMTVIGGVVALRRPRLDHRHRARHADLRGDHLRLHLPQARRLLPGDGEGRDHRRRRGARPVGGRRRAALPRTLEGNDHGDATIILETRDLTKHYGGVHALEDANFALHDGEHVAIMGDNGAGKSTFVRQITGVEQREPRRDLVLRPAGALRRAARGPQGRHRDGLPDAGARRRPRRALRTSSSGAR